MNESTALAQRLALQLGDDLDRILGPEGHDHDVVVDTRQDAGMELRQVAGLTAGAAMRLADGTYQFGQTADTNRGLNEGQPDEVGFTLTVNDGATWIAADDASVTLDGEPITERTLVGDGVIEAGSARFMAATPRRPVRRRQSGAPTLEPVDQLIAVPEELPPEAGAGPGRSAIRGLMRQLSHAETATTALTGLVREHRRAILARRRAAHPHAEEIAYRARNVRSVGWDRRLDHPHFGQVAIALGDLPWIPQFDRPDRVSTRAAEGFRHLHTLPSVPITADVQRGPLGIVGNRVSALAVARHVMVALAALTPPTDLTLAVLADDHLAPDWAWADQLPHVSHASDDGFPVLMMDGLHHAADPSLAEVLHSPGRFGCVLIGDDVNELPPVCSTVVVIDDHGTATVIDNRDSTTVMRTTPLGLTPDLAASAAQALRSFAG